MKQNRPTQAMNILALAFCLLSAISAFAASTPCANNPDTRQLDYWIGSWTLPSSNGSGTTTSNVHLSLDQCMFVEHWENGKGHVTEKMFAYSPEDKKWAGMFADNEGRVHIFPDGVVSSGKAEFRGPSRGPNGELILHRLTVVRTAPNKLQETWEKSTDNGANWSTAYSAEYVRANR